MIGTIITNDGQGPMYRCEGDGVQVPWDHDDDPDTDDEVICGVNLAEYFHDDGLLDYLPSVLMDAGKTVASLPLQGDDLAVSFSATALTTEMPFLATQDDTISVNAYTDATAEVIAMDGDGLWTSQTFTIRRNRRPVMLPPTGSFLGVPPVAHVVPTSIIVGTSGDGSVGDHHMVKIAATSIFADDDTIRLNVSQIDDYTVAYDMTDGNDVVVVGNEVDETEVVEIETMIHMVAEDTGGLRSAQHSITIMVDPGPTLHATNRLPETIITVLEAQGNEYTIADVVADYFDHLVPTDGDAAGNGETLTLEPDSSNESIATVAIDAGNLVITLKAVGDTEITVTATESGEADDGDPEQKAEFSFLLIVEAE
jgi:hypothetical protein